MKKILLIIICISIFRLHLQAQTTSKAGFDVNIYHPSVNSFFDQHENIDHIILFYNKNDVETIEVFFRGQPVPILGERYILTFDGDLYLFNKKYKQFPIPEATTAQLTNFQGTKNLADVNIAYNLTTTIRRDSLKHHFNFYTYSGSTEPNLSPIGYYPTFGGDIFTLTKNLEQDFKRWKPITVTDSVIIMTGMVEKNGTIGKLKLIEGKSSAYSDKVFDFLSREANSWIPRFDGGGKRAWPVRISVRVNSDESMRISIL